MVEGTTATDLVLVIAQMLREGVVGKFVEFYGPGLSNLSLADCATIANMAPEYGATCGFFPIDAETCRYLAFTGRTRRLRWLKPTPRLSMWRDESTPDPVFTDTRSWIWAPWCYAAGPSARRTGCCWSEATDEFSSHLAADLKGKPQDAGKGSAPVAGADYSMDNGDGDRRHHPCTNTEPIGAGRRRSGGKEGKRTGLDLQAVGQDLAGTGLAGGHRLPREGRLRITSTPMARSGRLRLHHLHRQLRPAEARNRVRHHRRRRARRRCCRATVTSKGGCTR